MRPALVIFMVLTLVALSACGKRPSELETPAGSAYPHVYPVPEQIP